MAGQDFATYEDFWPFYVAMHSKRATRWLHLAGTLTGLGLASAGVARGRWKALGWLPGFGYGVAWPTHFLVEGNNPASFGHPAWSLRGDITMIVMMLRGRDAELGELAARWLSEQSRPQPQPATLSAVAAAVASVG